VRQRQQGASGGAQAKKVENSSWQLEGSKSGSRWASNIAKDFLGEQQKSSTMLVQAHAGEAQAARGFWGSPGKKKSLIAAGSLRGAAQKAGEPPVWLKRAWGSKIDCPPCC
jgi:hypothetical protein